MPAKTSAEFDQDMKEKNEQLAAATPGPTEVPPPVAAPPPAAKKKAATKPNGHSNGHNGHGMITKEQLEAALNGMVYDVRIDHKEGKHKVDYKKRLTKLVIQEDAFTKEHLAGTRGLDMTLPRAVRREAGVKGHKELFLKKFTETLFRRARVSENED